MFFEPDLGEKKCLVILITLSNPYLRFRKLKPKPSDSFSAKIAVSLLSMPNNHDHAAIFIISYKIARDVNKKLRLRSLAAV